MRDAIVSAGLMRGLRGVAAFYPSRVTIQAATVGSRDGAGAPVTNWATLAGHANLPASLAPTSGAAERRLAQMTVTTETYTVALAGGFPAITERMRAVVDGTAYDILAVDIDSHGATTRLIVERVTT